MLGYQFVQFYSTGAGLTASTPITIWGTEVSIYGAGCVAAVLYESCALAFAVEFYRARKIGYAIAALSLLFVCMLQTARIEMEAQVTPQADKLASRAAVAKDRAGIEQDLDAKRKWLGKLQDKDVTKGTSKEIARVDAEIEGLKKQLGGHEASAGGSPVAQVFARGLGSTEQAWSDGFFILGLIFWTLVRALALPLSIGAMQMAFERKPRDVASTSKVLPTQPAALPTVSPVLPAQRAAPRVPVILKSITPQEILRFTLESLPHGVVDRKSIVENMTASCSTHGVTMPNDTALAEMLQAEGATQATRSARGARYFNPHGRHMEAQLAASA
jgi:hypothetical protein